MSVTCDTGRHWWYPDFNDDLDLDKQLMQLEDASTTHQTGWSFEDDIWFPKFSSSPTFSPCPSQLRFSGGGHHYTMPDTSPIEHNSECDGLPENAMPDEKVIAEHEN